MTPAKLRLLADSLERDYMTAEDRHRWIADLRGFANDVANSVLLRIPSPSGAGIKELRSTQS